MSMLAVSFLIHKYTRDLLVNAQYLVQKIQSFEKPELIISRKTALSEGWTAVLNSDYVCTYLNSHACVELSSMAYADPPILFEK